MDDVNGSPCPLPPVGLANGEPSGSPEGVMSLCFLQPEVAPLGQTGPLITKQLICSLPLFWVLLTSPPSPWILGVDSSTAASPAFLF